MGDGPVVDRREVERVARLAHVTLDDHLHVDPWRHGASDGG